LAAEHSGLTRRLDAREFAGVLAAKLAAVGTLQPDALARLLPLGVRPDDKSRSLLNCLHVELLRRTVVHARTHAAYYRDRSSYRDQVDPLPGEAPVTSQWPILQRQDVCADFQGFIADDVALHSIAHTSGTTGQPLEVYRSFEEVHFVQEYYVTLLESLRRSQRRRPLSLFFPNQHHGVPLPIPSPGMPLVGGVSDDTLIVDALRVLRTPRKLPGYADRITAIGGLTFHVVFFTSYLIEQGIDPREFGIETLSCTGGFFPATLRRFLATAWGATVSDRFSLTETLGGGWRCDLCGHFHLDPHLFGEVVDVDSGDPLEEGIGSLLLTSLYPFVQMQPMIRYMTGDLVRRVRSDCSGTMTFDFLGKLKNAQSRMAGGRRQWLIFTAPLTDVLAELPDLHRQDWFRNVSVVQDRTAGILPTFGLRHEETKGVHRIVLSLELRYAPHLFAERMGELTERILATLRAVDDTSLAAGLDDGSVQFDIEYNGPGGFRGPVLIKI
jgi:hypothetical protein